MTGTPIERARGSRRRVLGLIAGTMVCVGMLRPAMAMAALTPERKLSFLNTHTGERLETIYWQNGHYLPESLADVDWLLRDFRTNETKAIDTRLLDLLHTLSTELEGQEPLHVISGYRSAETNAMLARRSNRVAKNSYHMRGMAIDVRLPGCSLKSVRDCGLSLQRGGVGYYPKSNFVHLDTGPVRRW